MNVTFNKNFKDPRSNRGGVFLKGRVYHITGTLLSTLKKKKVIIEYKEIKIEHGNNLRNKSEDQ